MRACLIRCMNCCDVRLGERSCVRLGESLGEGLREGLHERLDKRFGEMLCKMLDINMLQV